MSSTTLLALILVAMTVVTVYALSKRTREVKEEGAVDKLVGVCQSALERSSTKQRRKQRILEMFEDRESLTNSDIAEQLPVSSRSIRRYLSELVKEGSVEQIGTSGPGVTYRLKS